MYNINDTVVYGMTGVCQITDITSQIFSGCDDKKYYVLKPLHADNSVIYAPCDTCNQKIRPMLSGDEVNKIIDVVGEEEPIKVPFFDKVKCSDIMKSGDRKELMRLVRSLDAAKKEIVKKGRKFHVADENIMRTAQKLLCDEFSLALDITPDEVLPLVLKQA